MPRATILAPRPKAPAKERTSPNAAARRGPAVVAPRRREAARQPVFRLTTPDRANRNAWPADAPATPQIDVRGERPTPRAAPGEGAGEMGGAPAAARPSPPALTVSPLARPDAALRQPADAARPAGDAAAHQPPAGLGGQRAPATAAAPTLDTAQAAGRPRRSEGESSPKLRRIAAAPKSPIQAQAMAQAQSIVEDCARSEAQVTQIAAARRQQIGSRFTAVRRGLTVFFTSTVASVQRFIDARQAEITAAVTATFNWVRTLVSGALKTARAMAVAARAAIGRALETITASIRDTVEGVAGQVTGLIDSIPLPDIPGIGRVRSAATGLLRGAADYLSGAVGSFAAFVQTALDVGMSLIDRALSAVERVLDAVLVAVMNAILAVVRMIGDALRSAVGLIGAALRTVLSGVIFPILKLVEGLIVRLLDGAASAARALLRANRNEFLDALADTVTPSRSAGRVESAATITAAIQQMGREAILNNRLIVLTFDFVTGGALATLFQLIAAAAARVLAAISSLVMQALRVVADAVRAVIQGFFSMAQAAGRFVSDLLRNLGSLISGLGQYVTSLVGRVGSRLVGFATGGLSRLRGFVTTFVRSLISGGGVRASFREALGEFQQTETCAPGYAPLPEYAPAFAGPPIQIIGGLIIILIGGVTIVVSVWVAVLVLVLLLILIILITWWLWPKPKPKPKPKRVISVTPSAAELGVGGRDINGAATIAPGTPPVPPLVWTINPGGTPPAGVRIIGTGQTVVVRAEHPPHGTVVGGNSIVVRAALASDPTDFANSTGVMLIQVLTGDYTAAPALVAVPSAIPGTPPPNTAEPNRDGITGNTATVNTTTAPAARPVAVTIRRPLAGTTVAGTTVTPGVATGDVGLRIADTATDARLDETRPPTSGPAARMADLTVNAVATDVRSLAFVGRDAAGPYSARNRINYVESDTLHTPLTRIIGELITGVRDDFNRPPPNGGFNPTFRLDLAVPANQWVDRLVAARNSLSTVDSRISIDVNRFVGPGVPQLPRFLIFRQRFQYAAWHGAGTVTSNTFADGQHIKILRGTPPSSFDVKIEHHFVGVTPSTPPPEPYAGPPLILLTNVVATPDAPGATALAADGRATAQLRVTSSVAGRTVLWSVLSGDITITAGNPATLPATATLRAGVRTGNFNVRAADNIYGNRQVDGTVGVVAVALRNMTATPNPVPAGTNSTTVRLDANPGGRTVNWSVDPAASGVTVTPATTGPGAPPMSVEVTRPAGFTGSVVVTAADSVVAAQTRRLRILFR